MNNLMASLRMAACAGLVIGVAGLARADSWPMRQRDAQNTGRSDFSVPASRQNTGFFDVFAWQTPVAGSPNDGNPDSGSFVFFDGAGPGGADLAVVGYHWPKGVQGLDRHTGRRLWSGNPGGGETIGALTPAFSVNGSTVYVLNDATESGEFPYGHPMMAFAASTGPGAFWHNGADAEPWNLGSGSPKVSPDGRIFVRSWNDRPYGGADSGSAIARVWAADTPVCTCYNDAALYMDGGALRVVSGGRCGEVRMFDGAGGATLWTKGVGVLMEAGATIDPGNGNIYLPVGGDSIQVVGLSKTGADLWSATSRPVFTYQEGVNNPQRAQSAGCLSANGATFYFQTVSEQGDGRLYAINTANGAVKWSVNTQSRGWELQASSPIVTANGVVIVGNNLGGAYYAVRDEGAAGTVLDTLPLASGANAAAAPALAADGMLYLPMRGTWVAGNGDGDSPDLATQNLFAAIDLRAGAAAVLPAPGNQRAFALSHRVDISWNALPATLSGFDHYAIYRATAPFTDLTGLTPIGTVSNRATTTYGDATALDGVRYYYAVSSVSTTGGEVTTVRSIGPRTPRTETDVQVVNIARTPVYPRYAPEYTGYEVTEPSGFGPYWFSAATGLGNGQNANTKHLPAIGEVLTYTATVRNRGTVTIAGPVSCRWVVNGVGQAPFGVPGPIAPGAARSVSVQRAYLAARESVRFEVLTGDARASNNAVEIDTHAVSFLTYADRTYLENYRENTPDEYPQANTDDLIDWLNAHMTRMNQMFADAGSPKRIHYGVLDVTEDGSADPGTDTLPYAIFPFRYYAHEGDPRLSGYYDRSQDIDFGLLHEMGHQLGLVDIYQWDLSPDRNDVSGSGYSSPACLMHGCSPFFSAQSALGMTHWQDVAHGYYGQYMYGIPAECRIRFLKFDGSPLANVAVWAYQYCDRPGLGARITDQVKFSGTTDSNGVLVLPNVPIDHALVPTTFAGDTLHDNPFGYVAVVGTNALMLFRIEDRGFTDYAWLDLAEVNAAYYGGQTQQATFERRTVLGGDIQNYPPADMAELNASSWSVWSQDGIISIEDDQVLTTYGAGSVKAVTTGGFDNYLRYPADRLAMWNLSGTQSLRMFCYAANTNSPQFQGPSPWIRVGSPGGYYEWRAPYDILNDAIGQWIELVIPLEGDGFWQRTQFGEPDLSRASFVEVHADTWGYGFTLWLDGVRFDPDLCHADFNQDGGVDGADVEAFFLAWEGGDVVADVNADGGIDGADVETFFTQWEGGGC